MQTAIIYILFIVGLILIIKGGDMFVDSASSIAKALGVPKFLIGATVVSIATTLPEMIVSIQATARGNADMAAGNAIGSVTANTAMIAGLFILCMPYAVKRKEFAPKALLMFASCAVLILGCIFTEKQTLSFEGEAKEYYTLSVLGSVILIGIFILFFTENLLAVKREHNLTENGERKSVSFENEIADNDKSGKKKSTFKNVFIFILGAVGIVFGARLLVDYGTQIALDLGIPQRTVSVGAIAIGTSLPELVTAVSALKRKSGALSIGNILGANIIDLTLILPICSFVSYASSGSLAVSVSSVNTDAVICLAAIAIVVFPTLICKKFCRWQGAVLLAGYAVYIAMLFVQS